MNRCTYLLLLLSYLVAGCDPGCGPDADVEPRLTLSFSARSGVRFTARSLATHIYAVGTSQDLLDRANVYPAAPDSAASTVSFNLPYSLTADQTRYMLVSDVRRDTVTVNYRRVFSYKDRDCGYWVDVQPPTGYEQTAQPRNVDAAARTTIGRVGGVYYEGTYLNRGIFVDKYTKSTISVSIVLP